MISEQLHKDAIRFKEWHEGRAAQAKNCATFNVTPALQEIAAGHEKVAATIAALLDALPQPAPVPQAPGRRKGPPGITLEPQGHEPPAVPVVSDDILIEREYERVMGQHLRPQDRAGVLKVCRAILALRPAVEPMTPEQIAAIRDRVWSDGRQDTLNRFARAVEARHGITAKAEGGAP